MYRDRIRLPSLLNKVMSAADAAALIEDGMTVGMSGFTRAGEAKAVPQALAERAKTSPLKITLMTGASLGNDLDKQLTEAGVLARRMPFQVDSTLRKAINAGEVMFIDQHLSETVEQLRNNQLKLPDIAVIEAVAITELADDNGIIDAWAHLRGKVLVDIPAGSMNDEELADQVMLIQSVFGQMMQTIYQARADGVIDRLEHSAIERIGTEVAQQVIGLIKSTGANVREFPLAK